MPLYPTVGGTYMQIAELLVIGQQGGDLAQIPHIDTTAIKQHSIKTKLSKTESIIQNVEHTVLQ